MASACDVYKHGIKLGSGTCAAGSASITSYTAHLGRTCVRKNCQIVVTQAGIHKGRSWFARVTADNGAGTLTLSETCPFVGA